MTRNAPASGQLMSKLMLPSVRDAGRVGCGTEARLIYAQQSPKQSQVPCLQQRDGCLFGAEDKGILIHMVVPAPGGHRTTPSRSWCLDGRGHLEATRVVADKVGPVMLLALATAAATAATAGCRLASSGSTAPFPSALH